MSGFEEETYSIIFTSLKHPVRRKILRMLSEKPKNFSELLDALGISSSHLTYHLENLGELVFKTETGKYRLSTFGEAAVVTMSKVEEAPEIREPKRLPSLPIRWKFIFAVLMIGLVVLAGVSYIQHQSLNRIFTELNQTSAEYEKLSVEYEKLRELVELVERGATLQSKYTLRYELDIVGLSVRFQGPWYCVIFSLHDNSTLYLVLSINTVLSRSYLPVCVQEGNAFGNNETAPVIWSVNATHGCICSVPLPSKGWYTISLIGPISNTDMFRMPVTQNVDCELWFRTIHEGKHSPLIVTPEALARRLSIELLGGIHFEVKPETIELLSLELTPIEESPLIGRAKSIIIYVDGEETDYLETLPDKVWVVECECEGRVIPLPLMALPPFTRYFVQVVIDGDTGQQISFHSEEV